MLSYYNISYRKKRYGILVYEGERIDDIQLKGLKIIQNPEWFCFGIDAVLLSGFAKIKNKDTVIDLGCGNGILPLLLYGKYCPKHITGVEIQEQVAGMAKRSIELNKLTDRIDIYMGDIKDCANSLGKGIYDIVVTNPPYKKNKTGIKNPEDIKAVARHEILVNLDEVIKASSKLLKFGGKFYMVHRPERLKDIIISLNDNDLMLKRLRFVYPKLDKSPNMVLVEAAKSGGDFLKIDAPLYVYNSDGSYTDEVMKIYGRC